jgi:hypothetical protein
MTDNDLNRVTSTRRMMLQLLVLCCVAGILSVTVSPLSAAIRISPPVVLLDSPESSQQLLVFGPRDDDSQRDVTGTVSFRVVDPRIAVIDEGGIVRPLKEGRTEVVISHGQEQVRVPVVVTGLASPRPVSFQYEVIPILTKSRCNSGGCHGKAEGQNGFRLSIFGFDAAADHSALLKESRGRRVSPAFPERSLFLLKGTSEMPHGGGRKFVKGSARYRRLVRWIAEGAQFTSQNAASSRIVSIEVEPQRQVLLGGESQQLRVTAIDSVGRRRCVTLETEYESNADSIAEVDERGLIRASQIPGEAAILVRHLGHVAVCRITLPRRGVKFTRPSETNFIDTLVWDKLQRLGIEPSELAGDAEFMRRVFLDTTGTLPTAKEVRAFLKQTATDKRRRLIDTLLKRDEYADYWTMHWLDLLRADQLKVTPQGTVAMQRWLRRQFADNVSYDRFARQLLTQQGSTLAEGPGAFYKAITKPDELSRSFSQLLLGVRIECAQCHHHPSERWSQADYVGLAGFFTGVKLKKLPDGSQAIISQGGKDLPHPRTGELVAARALGAPPADFDGVTDRRQLLADWMVARDNPFFARAIANRLWAHYLGRGVVEPIDDIRDTNPATNEPLLHALADHLQHVNFDLKAFTRTLLNSRVYQLSSRSNASNREDNQSFSHAAYKALPAEVLLDAISHSTGVPEKFNGWPRGYRAVQVWDNRMPSYFFRIFGRPVRASVCECERSNEPSIAQALHLLNSPEIMEKIQHRRGRARHLADTTLSPAAIIDELYLGTLGRFPKVEEQTLMLEAFDGGDVDRRAATEDVLWALLNSREFVYNH